MGRRTDGEALSTAGHTGVVEYEPTELVVTALAGTPLAELEDVLARRTRALLLDARASIAAAPAVARLMANEMGNSQEWLEDQIRSYTTLANQYLLSP